MKNARIIRIRPVSWKISVEGQENTAHVRQLLEQMNIQTSEPQSEPTLTDIPVEAFVAQPAANSPLTQEELEAILERDPRIELKFEDR